jgi:hypothetical protein
VFIADTGNNRIRAVKGLPSFRKSQMLSSPHVADAGKRNIIRVSEFNGRRYEYSVTYSFILRSSPTCSFGFVRYDWDPNVAAIIGQSGTCAYAEGISAQNGASTSRLISPRSFCGPASNPPNICGSGAPQIGGRDVISGCFYIVDGTMLRRAVGECECLNSKQPLCPFPPPLTHTARSHN